MPGVPLITAGNAEVARGAAVDVENDGASAQCDDARATEEATRPRAENVHETVQRVLLARRSALRRP
jgi:hypothetical protein